MKTPDEYAAELLSRKGQITEFHLAHTIKCAMRDSRDACARAIDGEADRQSNVTFAAGMRCAADLLRNEMLIGGPVKAFVSDDRTEEEKSA